jgi:hypothetical protein
MDAMRRLVVVGLALIVSGCVSAQITRLVPTIYPPISPDQVTVLVDISELMTDTIRYERLAVITMSGDGGGFTDQADMLSKAREEAAKIGANAIILGGYEQGDFDALTGASLANEGSAIAIRYTVVQDTTMLQSR